MEVFNNTLQSKDGSPVGVENNKALTRDDTTTELLTLLLEEVKQIKTFLLENI